MRTARALIAAVGIATIAGSSGCVGDRRPTTANPPPQVVGPLPVAPRVTAPGPVPPLPQTVPDAVPKVEPKSRYGNPPYYDVFGKRYYVLSSSADYVERGVASWYGPGFHEVLTSTREPYDMYAMTAAHRTLPLPAYVRVTNLQNGRSVVVRVNDRGPFVDNRIIDLSYTAAAKLDMLREGTAMVEVRAIDIGSAPGTAAASGDSASGDSASGEPAANGKAAAGTALASGSASISGSAPALSPKPILFIQAGAFSDPANAERLAAKLRGGSYGRIWVRSDIIAGRRMYRVRIGPVADVRGFDRIYAALERDGVHDAHLAPD